MRQSYQALVVDDDPRIRKLIRVNLEPRGYRIREAEDGESAIHLFQQYPPDLLFLDLVMPGLSGIEVCRRVREQSDLPIIVLSAHDDEQLKVEALDAGADDYVSKPFSYEELMARVRAVMRRTTDQQPLEAQLHFDGLLIDLKARRVFADGQDVRLTRTEFALLAELANHPGVVLTHQELLARVWGPEYFDASHYLHVYFGRIRTKVGPKYSSLLETVPGIGYSLRPQSQP